MATAATVRKLLEGTSVPSAFVDELLGEAGSRWLMGATDEVVAAEAVLCHPPLAPGEIRAVADPPGGGARRLTVVATDRPGLLAGTAAVLAGAGMAVLDATATVLPESRLALQRLRVAGDTSRPVPDEAVWDFVGARLREVLGSGAEVATPWEPRGPVEVETQPQESGRVVVVVQAPDQLGLLHATASWFATHGCNVEAYHAAASDGTATGVFVVAGRVDPTRLAAWLGGGAAEPAPGGLIPLRVAVSAGRRAASLPFRLARTAARVLTRR